MDHVLESLREWENIWLDQIASAIQDEESEVYIKGLKRELSAIKKAIREINKVMLYQPGGEK